MACGARHTPAALNGNPADKRSQPGPWLFVAQVDLVAKEPGDAPPTTDFAQLLKSMPKNCDYSDVAADAAVPAQASA